MDSNHRRAVPSRFTVCPLWPLGYASKRTLQLLLRAWSRHPESNRGPTVYKTVALPLSYAGRPRREAQAPKPSGAGPLFLERRRVYSLRDTPGKAEGAPAFSAAWLSSLFSMPKLLRFAARIGCLLALAGLFEASCRAEDFSAVFYRVEWIRVEMPRSLVTGEDVRALVTLRNASQTTWPDPQMANPVDLNPARAVRLSYRWWEGNREVLVTDYITRADLPWPLRPGESVTLPLVVRAPEKPGRFRLQLDLVVELVTWFEGHGANRWIMPVQVRPKP
jgi:hypothetical protein